MAGGASAADPGRVQVQARGAREQLSRPHATHGNQQFQPLPTPSGPFPYRLDLETIVGPAHAAGLARRRAVSFHVIGDTGGVKFPVPQQIVADVMAHDFDDGGRLPLFCYHVGDVVYYNGETVQYYSQFYEPYFDYQPPIVGVPGNHDQDPIDPLLEPPLTGFVRTFCSTAPQVLPEARDAPRTTMVQPNVYWTLTAAQFTLVGLATNVPEGGQVDATQLAWLVGELQAAPRDRPLLIALHHPPYSADAHHGGSRRMADLLDEAFAQARRLPDLVLAGHVHNYQRFTRTTQGREIPYLVVGASGYWHLHAMAKDGGRDLAVPWDVPDSDLQLEGYVDDRHGFLRLTVSRRAIEGAYTTVPRPQESWSHGPIHVVDAFRVDTRAHTVLTTVI
jgi:acid phosphatase type 7